MAKVTIAGQAIVVTSTMKLSDLETIKKYRPEALTLYEGEGKEKEPVFAIGISSGNGNIGTYGAEFNRANAEGFAQLTMGVCVTPEEDVKDFVTEEIGRPLLKLNKLEETLASVVSEINAETAAIEQNITVVE